MSDIIIGKNTQTNTDYVITLPTVAIITGKKMAGKTFLMRQIIERKTDGRIILITNKPDSYRGLKEEIIKITKEHPDFEIDGHLTIADCSDVYDDDPDHIIDDAIRKFHKKIIKDDLIILDEAYPFFDDPDSKKELYDAIEESWREGSSFIIMTNRTNLILDEVPELMNLCTYAICMNQDKKTAEAFCALANPDRGRYELNEVYNLMDFGYALILKEDGSIDFIKVS